MSRPNLLLLLCFCVALVSCATKSSNDAPTPVVPPSANALDSLLTPITDIEAAYAGQQSDLSVTVKGTITRLLSDDTVGDNHQRFILQLSNGQTLLIAHNIDIAPRVVGISIGSMVYVHGDYMWNNQGGLIHWTHHDPDGLHEDGWIVFGADKFQ